MTDPKPPTAPVQQPLAAAVAKPAAPQPPAQLSQFELGKTKLKTFLDARAKEIQSEVVGDVIGAPRVINLIIGEVIKNPALVNCSLESWFNFAGSVARTGLEPGPFGHSYPVPFKNKTGQEEVQFIPGWKGLAYAAVRSGAALDVDAEVVLDGDKFEFRKGTDGDVLNHEATSTKARTEENMIGAYCIATLPAREGQPIRRKAWFMKKADILRRKACSKAQTADLWTKWVDEAFCKTVVRHSMWRLPLSHLTVEHREKLSQVFAAADAEDVYDVSATARDIPNTPSAPQTTEAKVMEAVAKAHPETVKEVTSNG